MRPEKKRRPWTPRASAIAAVIVVGVLGWLFGQASGAGSSTSAGEPSPAFAQAPAGVVDAGVKVDFPRTPSGAAAAVASYQRSFASTAILRPGVLRRRIEAVATPDYVDRMLAVNTPGTERIAAGPIGAGIADGLQTLYSAVPIGYDVESFSASQARVLTWGFTLLGDAGAVEPAAYFGVCHTELLWSGGRWRIAETQAAFGPTPRLATPPGDLGGYGVLPLAKRLKTYELAP
jgi:hypothetical protein